MTTPFTIRHRVQPDKWIVFHGDSMLAGSATEGNGAFAEGITDHNCIAGLVAAERIAAGWRFGDWNRYLNGQGFSYVYTNDPVSALHGNLVADALVNVDNVLLKAGTDHYVVLFAGSNDIHLNNKTGVETTALARTYLQARIAAGFAADHICLVTMLPRQLTHETERTDYNNGLRALAAEFGFPLADVATDPDIGLAGSEADEMMYHMQIHLCPDGLAIVASYITAAMFP